MTEVQTPDPDVYEQVKEWCRENLPHQGKWSLIGTIAEDLGLETFPHGQPHWDNQYPWNNDVAVALNQLSKEGHITQTPQGRGYKIMWREAQ